MTISRSLLGAARFPLLGCGGGQLEPPTGTSFGCGQQAGIAELQLLPLPGRPHDGKQLEFRVVGTTGDSVRGCIGRAGGHLSPRQRVAHKGCGGGPRGIASHHYLPHAERGACLLLRVAVQHKHGRVSASAGARLELRDLRPGDGL